MITQQDSYSFVLQTLPNKPGGFKDLSHEVRDCLSTIKNTINL